MITEMLLDKLINDLIEEEPFVPYAYLGSEKQWIVGIGFDIDPKGGAGISEAEASFLLHIDLMGQSKYISSSPSQRDGILAAEKEARKYHRYMYIDPITHLQMIGYGRIIDKRGLKGAGIRISEAKHILRGRLEILDFSLTRSFIGYKELSDPRKLVLLNMAYDMGLTKVSGFVDVRNAIMNGDHEKVFSEIKNSIYYKTFTNKAEKLCQTYIKNQYQE